jgi:imidazolonepropionase-like amidohydrolase
VVRDVVGGKWVEPSGEPENVIGEGLWAIPGLVDAHAHLATRELNTEPGVFADATTRAGDALEAGVTLILDKGWGDDTTIRLIEEVEPGERPEIEAAERIITVEGGYFPGFGRVVEGSEIRDAVAQAAAAGRGWVKLIGDWPRRGMGPMANFTAEELVVAVETAGEAGARVAIHTMARETPSLAVAAGVHSIEHGLFLEEDDVERLGARGGMWVPTVLRVEATIAQLGRESSGGRLLIEGLGRMRRLVPLAVEAGVRVLAGTDLIGAPSDVATEALHLSTLGLDAPAVLAAVTTSGFSATGRDHEFSIGAPADAVFFAANPLDDLSVLRHPRHVMRLGRVL